jgi:hypothetical protein
VNIKIQVDKRNYGRFAGLCGRWNALSSGNAEYMRIAAEKWRVFLALSLIAGGCGGAVTTSTKVPVAVRPVAREAGQEELLASYNAFARNLKTLNLSLDMKPVVGSKYSGVIDEYHDVKAFVLAGRPAQIRVIGQVPVVGKTVFDMASDGKTFEVSIPPKNKFLTGPVTFERTSAKPIENLRPQHLTEALLWPEVHKEEIVLLEEFNDETARYYVLTVLRGGYKNEVLRKIWFDRADLNVARLENFGPKGVLLSDARYGDWQPTAMGAPGATAGSATNSVAGSENGITQYPRKIRLERPHDDYRLEMSIAKVAVNEPMEAERFKLEAPAGAEIIRLGEGSGDKQP